MEMLNAPRNRHWKLKACRRDVHCKNTQACNYFHSSAEKRMADVVLRDGYRRPVCYAPFGNQHKCQCKLLHPDAWETNEARFNIAMWHKSRQPSLRDIERDLFRALFEKQQQSELAQRLLTANQNLENEVEMLKELRLCVICKVEERSFMFHGCMHLCLCDTCYVDLSKRAQATNTAILCPLCRGVPSHGVSGVFH